VKVMLMRAEAAVGDGDDGGGGGGGGDDDDDDDGDDDDDDGGGGDDDDDDEFEVCGLGFRPSPLNVYIVRVDLTDTDVCVATCNGCWNQGAFGDPMRRKLWRVRIDREMRL